MVFIFYYLGDQMMDDEIPGRGIRHASNEKAFKTLVALCEGERTLEIRRIKWRKTLWHSK
jgi:hypothetical protein